MKNLSVSHFTHLSSLRIMPPFTSLHGISKTLIPLKCLQNAHNTIKRGQVVGFLGSKTQEEPSECSVQTTRRTAAIGLTTLVLTWPFSDKISSAKDNGFWVEDHPLPRLTVTNNIANEKTGTRSFLKRGLFMPDIGLKGSVQRIKRYSFDLLAMADLVHADTLNYVRKYLRLKSTIIYYDFDKLISATPVDDEKQQLTDMANKLFDNFERLEEASRKKSLPETKSCYQETEVLLKDVMDRMDVLYETI
ncbi:photosynthetic NDH subunit of lumenal location 3, chloroplastic [Vigna radiata var. radiata]|uniref:Photosynthetic NDH subunit of lumenal location 3, chloroplastic n=1 Tax=Vigna radiata var. radiata TaxID=3916 RepID=A0A1S3VUE9_VIGRR|nr:photosynthetic NDH subunit of lumenal location 3, chloroplastic [Vigna radiata var. radiata]